MPVAGLEREEQRVDARARRRLLVAWQHPTTRAYDLVGCLDILAGTDAPYRFGYFRRAAKVDRFQPFIDLPNPAVTYTSSEVFPLFANRMTPRSRADYPQVAASVGLGSEADPFEVLARTGGKRVTDTVEVVSEPVVNPEGRLDVNFLAHGIRYIPHASAIIDDLAAGDALRVLSDVQNPHDRLAIALADRHTQTLGWIPRYLVEPIHRAANRTDWSDISVTVEHVGDRNGPPHLRLLCHLSAPWDPAHRVFEGDEYELPSDWNYAVR